ncbi:accessory gland-specific peptide 70A [Drosophila guanche]|uniref:accessory gland-specific peptide 70A n=1 Tax=Drosophila guanche TaxID=7266 RepID=UPI001471DBC0|nr:accessory gland-specific peptide 70A [Drosophila guanche]
MQFPISLTLLLVLVGVALGVPGRVPMRTSSTWGPRDIQKWCRLNFGPAWGGRGC